MVGLEDKSSLFKVGFTKELDKLAKRKNIVDIVGGTAKKVYNWYKRPWGSAARKSKAIRLFKGLESSKKRAIEGLAENRKKQIADYLKSSGGKPHPSLKKPRSHHWDSLTRQSEQRVRIAKQKKEALEKFKKARKSGKRLTNESKERFWPND